MNFPFLRRGEETIAFDGFSNSQLLATRAYRLLVKASLANASLAGDRFIFPSIIATILVETRRKVARRNSRSGTFRRVAPSVAKPRLRRINACVLTISADN